MKKITALSLITLLTSSNNSLSMLTKPKMLIKKQAKNYWIKTSYGNSLFSANALNDMNAYQLKSILSEVKSRNMDRMQENNSTIEQLQMQNTLLLEQFSIINNYLRNNEPSLETFWDIPKSIEYQAEPQQESVNAKKAETIETTLKELNIKRESLKTTIEGLKHYIPNDEEEEGCLYCMKEDLKRNLERTNLDIEKQHNELLTTELRTIRNTLLGKQNSSNKSHE